MDGAAIAAVVKSARYQISLPSKACAGFLSPNDVLERHKRCWWRVKLVQLPWLTFGKVVVQTIEKLPTGHVAGSRTRQNFVQFKSKSLRCPDSFVFGLVTPNFCEGYYKV